MLSRLLFTNVELVEDKNGNKKTILIIRIVEHITYLNENDK